MGKSGLGQFSFVFAFVGFFEVILHFGMFTPAVRSMARYKKRFSKYISSLFIIKLLTTISFSILIVVFLVWGRFGKPLTIAILLAMLVSIIGSFTSIYTMVYVAFERMKYFLIDIARDLFLIGLLFLILPVTKSIVYVFGAYLILATLRFIVLSGIISKKFPKIRLAVDFKACTALLKASFLFVLIHFGMVLFHNVDIVLLVKLTNYDIAGLFDLPYRIIQAVTIIPGCIVFVVFPSMSILHRKEKKEQLLLSFQKITKYSIYFMIPIFAALFVLAPKIITFFFSKDFVPSILALRILCGFGLFLTFHIVFRGFLYAMDKEKVNMLALLVGGILNVILNLLLIPKFGMYGAAVSTLIGYLVVAFICYIHISWWIQKTKVLKMLGKSVLAAGVMVIALLLTQPLNLFFSSFLGGVVYLSFVLLLGEFREEFKEFKNYLVGFFSR